MKKLALILLFVNLLNFSFAQENSNTYSKWYLKPSVGMNIPLTKLFSEKITDNLFDYNDKTFYWQVLSATYFISSKWGIDFTFQAGRSQYQLGHSHNISDRDERFNLELEEKYGDNYFVSPRSGAQYSNFSSGIDRGYLGLVYRFEKHKYYFLPSFSIGVTSFYTDWGHADLKEKGTNTVYKITYDTKKRPHDQFTFAPSVIVGYRLSKRIITNINLLYSYFKTDIEFVEELRNNFTEEVLTETFDYRKNIHNLTLGIGIIIELKPAPNKRNCCTTPKN